MEVKQKIMGRFRESYLIPQNKLWKRIIDALAAVFCFVSAIIALYLIQTQPNEKLLVVSNLIVWGYLITSLPLALLLYRESGLLKIERFILVIFILLSSMSLLFSVMSAFIKT
jgi:hypothetical protein